MKCYLETCKKNAIEGKFFCCALHKKEWIENNAREKKQTHTIQDLQHLFFKTARSKRRFNVLGEKIE